MDFLWGIFFCCWRLSIAHRTTYLLFSGGPGWSEVPSLVAKTWGQLAGLVLLHSTHIVLTEDALLLLTLKFSRLVLKPDRDKLSIFSCAEVSGRLVLCCALKPDHMCSEADAPRSELQHLVEGWCGLCCAHACIQSTKGCALSLLCCPNMCPCEANKQGTLTCVAYWEVAYWEQAQLSLFWVTIKFFLVLFSLSPSLSPPSLF